VNLVNSLAGLKPKAKEPASARILNGWIAHAERAIGSDGGRLGWLVVATIVTAALQRAVDESGRCLFLVKGGTMLQYRLPEISRATRDVDGLVRGSIDDFIKILDETLKFSWGAITLARSELEEIRVPGKLVFPRSFTITASLKGVVWRKVKVEISPDEGDAGQTQELVASPLLDCFGLPYPDSLACISMSYQIAQKVHGATGIHNPPTYINDRARDVIDILLLQKLIKETGAPTMQEILRAILDTFSVRANEAIITNRQPQTWPAMVVAWPHWEVSYKKAAESAGLTLGLQDAVENINNWLLTLDTAAFTEG
jgi:hypothetical protein